MKKNKAIAAIASAALAIALGSSVARCALDQGRDHDPVSPESVEEETEGLAMASLVGTEWVLENGGGEMSVVGGAFVEGSGPDADVTYFTVDEESPTEDGLTASVSATKDVTAGSKSFVLQVSATDSGGLRLACDALKGPYVSKPTADRRVEISGGGPDLEKSMGVPTSLIEEAISAHAAEKRPYASTATWEKEVWLDFGHGRASTTFVLDDASATVVTVLVENGEVEVL